MGIAEIIAIITGALGGIMKLAKVSREALAKGLEEMAKDVRSGALLPDDLFDQAKSDQDRLASIRDNLPE